MTTRNQSLDVLRGVAVLMVIFHHYVPPDSASILHVGGSGVYLFFVLSGYLICGLLFRELLSTGSLRVGRFIVRRGLKIYPAFYAFLVLTIPLVPRNEYTRLPAESLFLQQYLPHVWQHTWSLSVEETFYFTVPIVIAVLFRLRSMRVFPIFCVAICVGLTCLRGIGLDPIKLEGLALGGCLAYAHVYWPERFTTFARQWRVLVPLCVVLLIPEFLLRGSMVFTTSTVAFACVVAVAAVIPDIRGFGIEKIGRYSYSIYLWHMPIALFWQVVDPRRSAISFVANTVCSVLVGVGMAKLIEMPVLEIRDRLLPSVSPRSHSCSRLELAETSAAEQKPALGSVYMQNLSPLAKTQP